MSRKYFGTDGIRGVANEDPLLPETVVQIGKAIACHFRKEDRRARILIGKDTRLSGYMIETALASGITSMGVDVLLTGPIPSPGVAYLTKSMRADAGIVISASHNSYEDNGIKIFNSDGYKLSDQIESEIESDIDSPILNEKVIKAMMIGKANRIDDAIGRYTVFLKSAFPRELSLCGMKLGMDCANGAAYIVSPQTCEELGAEVVTRGKSPNGRNINAGFGSLFPEIMQELVTEQSLDLGISFDGDADRAIFVDEKGQVHDGDTVLAICAIDLKKRGLLRSNKVVGTVMSNLGLERTLNDNGIELIRTAVGDRYVLEAMLEHNINLGGEQSGHTIFSDFSTTGDGMLTALMLLAVVSRTQKTLSELAAEFVRYPQKLRSIEVTDKPPLETVPDLQTMIQQKESEMGEKGRILVRYSGTENKARVMVECDSEDSCERHVDEIAGILERAIGTGM